MVILTVDDRNVELRFLQCASDRETERPPKPAPTITRCGRVFPDLSIVCISDIRTRTVSSFKRLARQLNPISTHTQPLPCTRQDRRRAESESDDGEERPGSVPPSGADTGHQECDPKGCGSDDVSWPSTVKSSDRAHEDGCRAQTHDTREMPSETYGALGKPGR